MAESVAVDANAAHDPDLDSEDMEQREALPTGVEVFRITGPLFFGVAGELLDALRRVGQKPRVIVLRMRLVPLLDASGARALEEFVQQARIAGVRSEEHTSELQSLMRISYAVFCLKKKKNTKQTRH